jgi:hypothetical protein
VKAAHAQCIQAKNVKLDDAAELIDGMREMFAELSAEVDEATKLSESSQKKMQELKMKAAAAHRQFLGKNYLLMDDE